MEEISSTRRTLSLSLLFRIANPEVFLTLYIYFFFLAMDTCILQKTDITVFVSYADAPTTTENHGVWPTKIPARR